MGGLFHAFRFASDRLPKVDRGGVSSGWAAYHGLDDPALDTALPPEAAAALREEGGLARHAYPAFDLASFRSGDLSPVYFGSALRQIGVDLLLGGLADIARRRSAAGAAGAGRATTHA